MLSLKIISLFPSFFDSPLQQGVLGRAIKTGLLNIQFFNPRDYAENTCQSVDDSPFGGGEGMLMQYPVLQKTLIDLMKTDEDSAAKHRKNSGSKCQTPYKVYYLSPQGKKWDYKQARSWTQEPSVKRILICGRYSGLDQRFITEYVDEELSIGDYVLSGGEPAALVILDSMARFIKGALGNECSAVQDSFENQSLLEPPQWTKPRNIAGYQIPDLMLSGHHKNIKQFQYQLSLVVTALKRPDLLHNNPARCDLKTAVQAVQNLSTKELKTCGLNAKKLQFLLDSFTSS